MSRGMHRPYYSGALQFSVGGRPFYLNALYHKEPRARLLQPGGREELSVAYGDLECFLGGSPGRRMRTPVTFRSAGGDGAELTGLLAEYLSDMSDGGNAGIRVTRAVEKLEQKKEKPAVADQK